MSESSGDEGEWESEDDNDDLASEDDKDEDFELEGEKEAEDEVMADVEPRMVAAEASSEGEEEVQEAEDDEDAEDFQEGIAGGEIDVSALLKGMGEQEAGADSAKMQPYQYLKRARYQPAPVAKATRGKGSRASKTPSQAPEFSHSSEEEEVEARAQKARKKGKKVFGATVDDIWDDEDVDAVAAQMGLPTTTKAGKKQRDRMRRRRKAKASGKRTKQIPEEVSRKLGEANLLFATGKHAEAITLLEEVIKTAPNLSDPYHTLGLLNEEIGNKRKALDFYMIAAHMTPKDVALWKRLASLSSEIGFIRQAIYCLTKVIIRSKEDVDARWDRAIMLAELNENRKAAAAFEQIQDIRPGDGDVPLMLARLYHALQQPDKAVAALEAHVGGFPLATQPTHINILSELYMEKKQYDKAIALLENAASTICRETGLVIDLQTKLAICYVHAGNLEAALPGLEKLQKEASEDLFDLCLDAADALLATGHPQEALKLFITVQQGVEGTPSLWHKLAQCYAKLERMDKALQIYTDALKDKKIPREQREEAMMALAELHCDNDDKEHALKALEDFDKLGSSNIELLNRKAQTLLKMNEQERYLSIILPKMRAQIDLASKTKKGNTLTGLQAQAKKRKDIIKKKKDKEGQDGVFKGFVTQDRRKLERVAADERLASYLEDRGESEDDSDDDAAEAMDGGAREAEEQSRRDAKDSSAFPTILQIADILVETRRPLEASEFLADCVTFLARKWPDKEKKEILQFKAAVAALQAGEPALAIHHVRHAVAKYPHTNTPWNVFCKATTAQGQLRNVHRLIFPLRLQVADSLPLRLATGHCHSLNGHYGSALGEYLAAYNINPNEVVTLLSTAIAYLNQALGRKVSNRDETILAAFSFLQKYAKLRKNKQEAYYNLGRAAHQLDLLHIAVPYYQRALAEKPPQPLQTAGSMKPDVQSVDLSREIAFNLAQIYTGSGAKSLARSVLRKHFTV